MKKRKGYMLLYGASALMILGFLIHVFVDRLRYSAVLNSTPFWVWIAVDGMLWLIPALLAFLAGLVAHKKLSNKEKQQ